MPKFITTFLKHPVIATLRYVQFPLAITLFFYAALMPASNAPSQWPDGILHFLGNFLLVCSMCTAAFFRIHINKQIILCVGLSLLSETLQSFTLTRVFDPIDLVANLAGLTAGYFICLAATKLIKPLPH